MHKLFTRFLLTVIVALFSRAAFAEPDLLLYFQIDSSNLTFVENGSACSYDFAMVSFTTDGMNPSEEGYLDLYADGETVSQGQALSSGSEAAYASLGSNPSAESQILFELWSVSGDSFERVGYYTALYSDLTGNIMESGGVSPAMPLMIAQVHAEAVPEPTSGLLTVLGVAFLALRRKRV